MVEVEFMFFSVATGETAERVLATVSGMKTYFQVAAGTDSFELLRGMVSEAAARDSMIAGLQKATVRVRRLLGETEK